MGFYKFKDGVYLVQGKVNGCIYDLNDQGLYAIDENMKCALIELVNNHHVVNEEFVPVIQELMQMNILQESDTPAHVRDLKEIADQSHNWELAWIEVTKQCNLHCKHCYLESSPEAEGEMTWDDYTRAIQEMKENHVDTVRLIGGEPLLLNEKLCKMLEYATAHIQNVQVFTNATLVNELWIDFFQTHNIEVRMSLYSLDEENHEKVTGVKGSFQQSYQGCQLLKASGVPMSITCITMKGVERHGIEKEPLLRNMGLVRMHGRANLSLVDHELLRGVVFTEERFHQPLNLDQLKRSLCRHQCFGYKLYIDTDLNVYPCSSERHFAHGNIREHSLDEILQHEVLQLTKDHIEGCKDCEYRYVCFDCRSDRIADNPYAQPWWCTYVPLEGRWRDVDQYISDVLAGVS